MFQWQNCTFGAWRAEVVSAFLLVTAFSFCAQSTIVFQEDFETGIGGFIIDNTYKTGNGLWHITSSCKASLAGHSQGGVLYYGQDETCNYDIGIANRGVVESNPINLTNFGFRPIELRFKYYLDVEPASCGYYYDLDLDLASIAISADEMPFTTVARNCWASGLTELPNASAGWAEFTMDLSEYAGSVIQLRFDFNTVDYRNNDFDGFYIDDIIVYGLSCEYVIAGDSNHDCVVNMKDWAAMEDFNALLDNWLLNCYQTPSDPRCVPE